nr:hypothetical protein [Tanacetum cinerariifolium]
MLKDSIDNGPYQFKFEITVKDINGVTDIRRPQRLEDLDGQDKLRYDSDIKVVNILLFGLPIDIYTLINNYQTAKEIWDHVKELMEGIEMTKQECESMVYDEFEKFTYKPGESIHSYYLRFAKLINDMNMIPMSMTPMKINTNFLYAFLKHNERDVREVREMKQRFPEPLALLSNTYNPRPSYNSNQTQYQAQPYKVYQPYQHYQSSTPITQQLIQSPPRQCYAHTVVQQPLTFQPDITLVIPTFLPIDDPIGTKLRFIWFKEDSLKVMRVMLEIIKLQEEGLSMQLEIQGLEETDDCEDLQLQATTNFKVDHVDAYDSDCDDEATANAIFMENLSHVSSFNDDMVEPPYDSNIFFEVPYYDTYHDYDNLNSNIQELRYIENIVSNNESYDELKGNNDVISYIDYMLTIGNNEHNYVPPLVQKNDMMLSVIEQIKSQVEKCNNVNQEAQSVIESLTNELE